MTTDSFLTSPRMIVVVGTTASGKTEFAISLARKLIGEIISADSRQVYQEINLGTGKPSLAQQQLIPHHLLSLISVDQILTAEKFAEAARAVWNKIEKNNKQCLVVGGTGLWIRALIDGLAPVPPANLQLRKHLTERVEREGLGSLYQALQQIDPEKASSISNRDKIRIIRAYEIWHLTGEKPSVIKDRKPRHPPIPAIWLGITRPREELYSRAETRIEEWIKQGWVDEIRDLIQRGIPKTAPGMNAIGYRHLYDHLEGECSLAKAIELIKRDTRHYIKRQLTWFKAEKRIHWLTHTDSAALHQAEKLIIAHQQT